MKDAFFASMGSYPRIAESQRQLMGIRSIRSDNIADKVFKKNSRTPWALDLTEKIIRAKLFRKRWFQWIMKMIRFKAFFVSLHLKIYSPCNKS